MRRGFFILSLFYKKQQTTIIIFASTIKDNKSQMMRAE